MGSWALNPGINLRFIERDGKRILQQVWIKNYGLRPPPRAGIEHEWRDVPLCAEDADPSLSEHDNK